MRFANQNDRLHLVLEDGLVDVERASAGALPADPAAALERWSDVLAWAAGVTDAETVEYVESGLRAPSPEPRQVFAIGLNYAPHAKESGFDLPKYPFVFTKTAAALAGPFGDVVVPSETIDWEVELVVVIGASAYKVSQDEAWEHVAGLTVGQDFSDRAIQGRLGPNTQPTLAKSLPGFAPTGPYLVTPDEFADRDDIPLWCTVNGEEMQRSTTAGLIFGVAELVSYLSQDIPLFPGDLIFTGTPAGVGFGRSPQIYLKPGDVVETGIEGIGTIRQRCVAP
ncbi:fumarylacetoacetate hydrolase family protein [Leifsonia sp. NPDC058194]|uniref:fumarylacetoacetate hydrolase family protein n=1 Tax=Leifsonia sp. NPDC058194 TaxID=3346374 RepID=UPI0036D95DF0